MTKTEAEIKKRINIAQNMSKKEIKFGFPAEKNKNHSKFKGPVSNLATFHEFGTSRAPARPFFRLSNKRNRQKYKLLLRAKSLNVMRGNTNYLSMFKTLGFVSGNDVRSSIKSLFSPRNASSTIKKKGFDNPLIETGEMLNSVTHVIVNA